MDDLVSTPVVSPSQFLALKQKAKAELQQDLNLDKAAELSAQEKMLLMDEKIPPAMKTAQLKQLNPQIRLWTKKARQPFAGSSTDESNIDVGPTQSMVSALVKSITQAGGPTIKEEDIPTPAIPTPKVVKKKRRRADDLTPVQTPGTRPAKKKAKRRIAGEPTPRETPKSAPAGTSRQQAVEKGKKLVKQQAKKKAKEAAAASVRRWLDF